jgi:hypothetical protein
MIQFKCCFYEHFLFGQVMIIHIKITRINVIPLGKVSNWAKSLSLSSPLLPSTLFLFSYVFIWFSIVHYYLCQISKLCNFKSMFIIIGLKQVDYKIIIYITFIYQYKCFFKFVCFVCDHVLTLPNRDTPHYIFGTMERIFNEAMCTMVVS